MNGDPVIALHGVSKTYAQYARPLDRLLEALTGQPRHQTFTALEPLDLVVPRGAVLGVIGMNGAGKSTLLKIIAGTLEPSAGRRTVVGRLSALLELGAGFHPEMTGRENVYLAAAVQGWSRAQVDAMYADIVSFSGLGPFMDQPVKTYSSGMFVRLAFSVATAVRPDILIVDEALSVGDGAFARLSFERIMRFKEEGSTILFCSHSLYQVEAICSRVIWVHQGRVVLDGQPEDVTAAYQSFLDTGLMPGAEPAPGAPMPDAMMQPNLASTSRDEYTARLRRVRVDSPQGRRDGGMLVVMSGASDLDITIEYRSDPALAPPSLAATLVRLDGTIVASAGSHNDGVVLPRDVDGRGQATLRFERLPLLKGEYGVSVYLMCEQAIHIYDQAEFVSRFRVQQQGLEQGLVHLPHVWVASEVRRAAPTVAAG